MKPTESPPAFMGAEWFRKMQLELMLHTFARALEVPAPAVRGMSSEKLLRTFAAFSALQTGKALAEPDGGARKARRLFDGAHRLGQAVRALPPFRHVGTMELVAALYRNIGIAARGELPGELVMGPCYFSAFYSPATCAFMRSFDAGVMSGIAGDGSLDFESRITQGAPCCRALFTLEGDLQ